MILGTAGHIDHGKTTLVRALTGVDTDRLPEEKRRGITIEPGFAPLVLPGIGTIGLVDVPGHEAFIHNMLAGATGIDLALLVVAADEGVMPQTREHVAILSLLGVARGVVALTKCDTVEREWMAMVHDDVRALVRGTPLEAAPVIETAAPSGAGVEALRDALASAARAIPERAHDDLFRLPIDRAFTVKGTGTVVTGTVWSGSVTTETPLRLLPANVPVRARGVQSHGQAQTVITPGHRAAIALAGVDLADVSRGAMLAEDGGWTSARVLRADVALLDGVAPPLRAREWVRLHIATTEVGARVVTPGGALEPGGVRGARLMLDHAVTCRAGDRFVLRRSSPVATIGGGIITDCAPPGGRVRPWVPGLGVAARLQLVVREARGEGLPIAALPVRLGIPAQAAATLVAQTPAVVQLGDRLVARSVLDTVTGDVVAAVERYHEERPLEDVVPLAWLRGAVGAPEMVVAAALRALMHGGEVVPGTNGVRRRGWEATFTPADVSTREWLLARLQRAGREPPTVRELQSERGGNDLYPLLRILERAGGVVQVDGDRYYASEVVTGLVEILRKEMVPGRVYVPAELRELLGGTRKFLIPFLEYCDRQGITERRMEGRVLGA